MITNLDFYDNLIDYLKKNGLEVSSKTAEETSARPFLFTHQGRLATEDRLQEWPTHFWGNS